MQSTKKTSQFKREIVSHSFTGKQLTSYAGLSPQMQQITSMFKLREKLGILFPTVQHNATKFTTVQAMMAIVLASFAGIHRLSRIAIFSHDALVQRLLGLKKGLNKDVISTRFKKLGQAGAIGLHEFGLELNKSQLKKAQQEGAAKGFNSQKKGARSYHPLLAFCSEMKLILNSWFRAGSAYISNGILDFVAQTAATLPASISSVFFRADSGFFNGLLFDLLDELKWSYLVKVKLKGLKLLLEKQTWFLDSTNTWIQRIPMSLGVNLNTKQRTGKKPGN